MSADAPRRLHPATVLLDLVRRGPSTVLAIPAALAVSSDLGWATIAGLAVAAGVVWAAARAVGWWRFTYALTPDALVIDHGVLGRQRRTIPFDRVEDVNIERPLLARLLGLARVTLETGGAGADEGALDSVSVAEAERLRAVIRGGGGTARVPDADGAPLFAMGTGRVLLSGLFGFSLVWLAVVGAAAQYADDWWLRALGDAGWLDRVGQGARAATPLVWAGLALLVLALGVGAGLVRTTLRDHGFRLMDEGSRLRRTRGLLTRSDVVIARGRIQLAAVRTGPLTRAFGWRRVSAQTLGGADGQGAGGRQPLAPFATRVEADRVLAAIDCAEAPGDRLRPVARGHGWRLLLRSGPWPLLAAGAALAVDRPAWSVAGFALFALLAARAILARRHYRYGIVGDQLCVTRGALGRTGWLVPLERVQSVAVRSGWLQRRLGLATVVVDTAGAPALAGPHVHDVSAGDAWSLADRLRGAAGRARLCGAPDPL